MLWGTRGGPCARGEGPVHMGRARPLGDAGRALCTWGRPCAHREAPCSGGLGEGLSSGGQVRDLLRPEARSTPSFSPYAFRRSV